MYTFCPFNLSLFQPDVPQLSEGRIWIYLSLIVLSISVVVSVRVVALLEITVVPIRPSVVSVLVIIPVRSCVVPVGIVPSIVSVGLSVLIVPSTWTELVVLHLLFTL